MAHPASAPASRRCRVKPGMGAVQRDMACGSVMTRRLDGSGVGEAAAILRAGGLVAWPTETVYGLGASARDGRAVARVFEAKGRPRFNPLIVHVAEAEAAFALGLADDDARAAAAAFWPGPLTLLLPLRPGAGLSDLVTAGTGRVALRVPSHPLALALLDAFGGPVAAPSANASGRISPTTAEHVLADLAGRIDAVLDGGPCAVGVESTIVGLGEGAPRLLRPGGVPAEAIEAVLGRGLAAPGDAAMSPGRMASHYAPRGAVRLDATAPREGERMLGFGPVPGDLTLSASGDLVEAAAGLFAALHTLDAMGGPIAVAPIPDEGLGRAIRDRLARAAAPRGDGAQGPASAADDVPARPAADGD